jgi:hypothetical protein
MASVSRSLDLTGSDWGLRKKHKDRHRESCGPVSPALLMRDAGDILHLQAHLFIQHVWESGVKCRLSSHGSSHIGGRNSTSVECCHLVQTILTRSVCPVFLAKQPCWTLPALGWVCTYQPRGPWCSRAHVKGYFHCLSLLTCKAALLNLAHFLPASALPSAQRTLTWLCSYQGFFWVYLATGLPQSILLFASRDRVRGT